MSERAFSFIPINRRQSKPRSRGLTEIRGPHYAAMRPRFVKDVLGTMGVYALGTRRFSLSRRAQARASQATVCQRTSGQAARAQCVAASPLSGSRAISRQSGASAGAS